MADQPDPVEADAAVMQKAEALLAEVHQARSRLAAAPESPERTVYLAMLESFERGLLAAFDGVVAELKTQRADIEGYGWLRRRLEGLTGGSHGHAL